MSKVGRVRRLLKKLRALASGGITKSDSGKATKGEKATFQMANSEYHLTCNELNRLIRAGKCNRDIVMIKLFSETGIRRFELAELRAADIDTKNLLLTVRNGKGNKTRQIPVTDTLATGLSSLMDGDASRRLFISARGESLSLRQINRIVASTAERAGVRQLNPRYKNVGCHLLRHTFARMWKASGGSIETLSKIMGHSSTRTTWETYGTESIFDIEKNYQRTIRRMFKARKSVE